MLLAESLLWKIELVATDGEVTLIDENCTDRRDAMDLARRTWKARHKTLREISLVGFDDGAESHRETLWIRPVTADKVHPGHYAVNGKRYTVRRPDSGKWAGWTFLATGSEYHEQMTLATFRPGGQPTQRTIGSHGLSVMDAICANPLERMREYGRITGHCGRCGRLLEDAASIAAGIGPICIQKMGA